MKLAHICGVLKAYLKNLAETPTDLLPMKRQWTHGPTLLLWRSHLHTALRLFQILSQMNFKLK